MSPRRRWLLAGAGVAVVAIVAAVLWPRPEPEVEASPSPTPALPSATPTPVEEGFTPGEVIATIAGDELALFDSPGAAEPADSLGPWSLYGSELTLLAFAEESVDGQRWLEVGLPGAPNHRTAWVKDEDVTESSTTLTLHVYLDEREVELTDGSDVLLTSSAVIGDPETPTPEGVYWITDPLDFTPNPTGVYGAYALGLNGYSEVLEEFNGGPPQLAVHGTNEPDLMGSAVSNGCIRVPNDVVLDLAERVDLGTPVIVHASRGATA